MRQAHCTSSVVLPAEGAAAASTPARALTFGVVVPTFRRPDGLRECLFGLMRQQRRPDDVIITVREDDDATLKLLRDYTFEPLDLRILTTTIPGLVPACNLALASCRTDILAFLDDDSVPHPDWSERIVDAFERDPRIGGLGGKDRLFDGDVLITGASARVGRVSWFGRVLSNHHLGFGVPRDVDFLKGTNMSFRALAFDDVRFDTRLRGGGIQANHDLAFSLAIRRAGWRVAYDPSIVVDHYTLPGVRARPYVDVVPIRDVKTYDDWAFNEVTALWDDLSFTRRLAFVSWSILVGTRVTPGLVQAFRFTPALGRASWQRFVLAQSGKFRAIRSMSWSGRGG